MAVLDSPSHLCQGYSAHRLQLCSDFTLTISWARIPPTTAHTGAISEKQYLGEKTSGVKHCGVGLLRVSGKVGRGPLAENAGTAA